MGFTYKGYETLLKTFLMAGYRFIFHEDALQDDCCGPVAVMRHDLDVDLEKAVRLARVEKEVGVCSTFCVMLRSGAYNLFSAENTARLQEMVGLGHHVGLHFDTAAYGSPGAEAAGKYALSEAKLLEAAMGYPIRLVSFHRPNAMVLSRSQGLPDPLIHAYDRVFVESMTYFSDSYGFWRFGRPNESQAFRERRPLNLNTHPIWWNEQEISPLFALNRFMESKRAEVREYMLTNIVGV